MTAGRIVSLYDLAFGLLVIAAEQMLRMLYDYDLLAPTELPCARGTDSVGNPLDALPQYGIHCKAR